MKAITRLGATPNRMGILFEMLADAGREGISRDRAAALIGPPSLARSSDTGEDNAFSDCVATGLELGIFREEDDRLCLTSQEGGASGTFLQVADAIMVDAPLTTTTPEGWMAGAIAWMLCQDPRDPVPWTGSAGVTRLRAQMPSGPTFGMTNDSAFQQAVYWARALGYVDRFSLPQDAVLPDPTNAVARRLPHILRAGEEVSLPAMLSDLAKSCPVLDGGRCRVEVEALCRRSPRGPEVSSSLALALLRLKRRGRLRFQSLSDAQSVFVEGLPHGRASHVTLLEV